jgi:hypothetical protein
MMNELATDLIRLDKYITPRATPKPTPPEPEKVNVEKVEKARTVRKNAQSGKNPNNRPKVAVKTQADDQEIKVQKQPMQIAQDVTPTHGPTLEEIAAKVLLPMKVVRRDGKIENIDSGIRVECPRGHIHNYLLADIMKYQPVCVTCSRGGVTTKRIRSQIEEIFSTPFVFCTGDKKYSHFTATIVACAEGAPAELVRPCSANLFIVKGGYDVPTALRTGFCIILPESQSKEFVNTCIYKHCRGYNFGSAQTKINALVDVKKKPIKMLPYSPVFASHELKYNILQTEMLYIENCGWKK